MTITTKGGQKLGEGTNQENEQTQRETELEQAVADKESEITALKKTEGGLKEKLSALDTSLAEAVKSYKGRVIQLNPGLTEELIEGGTIEAIDKSLKKALGIIGRVKKSVEKEISHSRVPAGAPGRRSADLSGLSPREKIQYAIGGKK